MPGLTTDMRIVVDYRPALRARTGVGEWIHNLVRAVISLPDHLAAARAVSVFVSSWKDRPHPEARDDLAGAAFIDRRIPVRVLTWAWHRLGWPTVEDLTRRTFDVAFSPTPLLLPSRAPLRVVTVHDLDFLAHPERTRGEMRRDYPALVARHTRQADLVVTISHFMAAEARRVLGVPSERIVVVRPGVPDWVTAAQSRVEERPTAAGRYILFVGTLEARKNVAGLLDAYARLVSLAPDAPRLVLAGGLTPESAAWLARVAEGPAAGRVDARGYIQPADRAALYAGAAMLVLPSFMEGFGLPVLEAMALGVPVVISTKGALPEVAGTAGLAVPPEDTRGLAQAMHRVLHEPGLAAAMQERGSEHARQFCWEQSAVTLVEACADGLRRSRGTTRAHRH